jgi:hypothetical protein
MRSRRAISRSASRLASGGRPAFSIRSRSSPSSACSSRARQLALDRLELLAQEVLALRLAHLLLGLGLDLATQLQHLQLVRHVAEEALELGLRGVELEDLLALLSGKPDVVGDVVREVKRVVDRAGGARQLGWQVGGERHQLLERRDRAPHHRLALDGEDVLPDLGVHLDGAREVGVLGLDLGQPDAAQAQHSELHRPVRQLQQVLDATIVPTWWMS